MNGSVTANGISTALGIAKSSVTRRAASESWSFTEETIRGGKLRKYPIANLPSDIQTKLIESTECIPYELIPYLSPEAALVAHRKMSPAPAICAPLTPARETWTKETAIDPKILDSPKVCKKVEIVNEALAVPRGQKKSAWIDIVAGKHEVTRQHVYKLIQKFQKKGIAAFAHTKKNAGLPKKWDPMAIDWWIGLCLKREHRGMAKDALYEILKAEAGKSNWSIGSYESGLWWYNRKVTPQLEAYQNGGIRALDNMLPPVLRNYSDLAPFELLCGDQHKWDRWLFDPDTGSIFRPESYVWIDLRSRAVYGIATDRRYDSLLMGLSLRIGMKVLGAFGSIYTDNGKPECAHYITGILTEMSKLGLSFDYTIDACSGEINEDGELVNPCVILPGTHKKAIVRNAKAKMIEGFFNVMEGIMRDHFRLPGDAKRLTDSGEKQDVDHQEIQKLAEQGKLLTLYEYNRYLFQALDYYNRRHHRGLQREWIWKPMPATTAPMDCLQQCWTDGWRPKRFSDEAIDLLFLAKGSRPRTVDRGRVWFNNIPYEHDGLEKLHGHKLDFRYDPMDPEYLLLFEDGKFICRAIPVEHSSMKNQALASRKIEEKARRRKEVLTEYRRYISTIPDFRNYSQEPRAQVEHVACEIRTKDQSDAAAQEERYRVRTDEELAAEVAQIDNWKPKARPVFVRDDDRMGWIVEQQLKGIALSEEDQAFFDDRWSKLKPEGRKFWEDYKDSVRV